MLSVLLSWLLKYHWLGGLSTTEMYFSRFGRQGRHGHGAGMVDVCWELLHVADSLLPVSSHDGKIDNVPSSYNGTNSIHKGSTLIT